MTSERLAIVLIADQAYTEQLAVTMKSIMYHNKSVDFYIINQGIMPDWFRKIRRIVKMLGGNVYSIPFDMGKISSQLETSSSSSLMPYAKYFIADLVDREKVLYLDSDTLVNGPLKSILSTDLEGFPVAAVKDIDGSFNTGVLLIDAVKWRDLSISTKCLELHANLENEQLESETSKNVHRVLNQIFKDNWLELDKRFNVQVGHDIVAFYSNWQDHFYMKDSPLIIHYTTYRKPWNSSTSYRYREKWWEFYNLELSQVLAHHLGEFSLQKEKQGLDFFTLTETEQFEGIEHLASTFPEHRFHIAAYTVFGPWLSALGKRDNIYLHPECTPATFDQLLENMDAYLNINHGDIDEAILERMSEMNKPIFSFYATHKGNVPQYLFLRQELEKMEDAIRLFYEIGADKFRQTFKQEELFDISVMSIDETLDELLETEKSLVRFGDGEFNLINGNSIAYQEYQEDLAQEMREILLHADDTENKVLICLPEIFEIFKGSFLQNEDSEKFWKQVLDDYGRFFQETCRAKVYGSTWISRPYIDNKDKSHAITQFEKIKSLFENKDILIVEGATTRSGVGNDLFNNVLSIKRIICPSHHAFSKVDAIQQAILDHASGRIILLMLGPTAKILAYRLSQLGYRALDLGHIDPEYEWMKMGAETKVQLKHKHTAEFNFDQGIEFVEDEDYNSQIVVDLSK
ncbi:SP_1767 family glycosyltransferase [Streptococcus sp. IMAU 99125]|uniref:SP_1767 family glycosyltransferase n=1 Tax=Streptococcus humanilactis TaxID=2841061 RepID=A0ABS7DUK7_9STRE|nr:SP_1767 family glycosyltransferase [Streptococcus humanilactis]MBW7579682.1 SP_1767 family glycosyltransferase [Streptococcus humanilactis]MBW7581544.1 SP_1767 family glycosyltransferase [Streptococcus humanilactis]